MKFYQYNIPTLICILLFNLSYSQTYNPAPQTWIINAETANCENKKNECLLVKQPGHKTFELFYDDIEGFNYEKGNEYTITVKQAIKQPPIAVGESVFKYVLVKINSQKNKLIQSDKINNNTSYDNTAQKILDINFETVPCESNSKYCLLIKEKGKTEYEIFNGNIYGFNYQPGYAYTIAVKETNYGEYYLVKEINKKYVNANVATSYNNNVDTPTKVIAQSTIQSSSTLDGKWYLRKMKDIDGTSIVTDDNVINIDIKTFTDRIDGFGACNKFAAVLKSDLNTSFNVSKLTSDFANCGNKKIEDLFYDVLQQADRFEIKNGNLILSKQWNFLLGFTKNPNNKEDILTTYTPPNIVRNNNNIYATNQAEEKTATIQNNINNTENINQNSSDAKDKEIEALKKQIEAQEAALKAKKEAEVLAIKQKAIDDEAKQKAAAEKEKQIAIQQEKEKVAKLKELEELKKKQAELQTALDNNSNTTTNITTQSTKTTSTKPNEIKTTAGNKNNNTEVNTIDENEIDEAPKVKIASNYVITKFTTNNGNNIPDPEFPLRPYYLDGNELVKLERAEANFAAKKKGVYRGVDMQVQIMKEESPIQFLKNNLPRFFVVINDEDTDPFDIIDLCKADRIGKGRRNFTYAGKKYGGRVKDVTGKLVSLDFKKIRNGLYEIIIDQELEQGEYAFLPLFKNDQSLSSTNSIKANCFGIVDPDK